MPNNPPVAVPTVRTSIARRVRRGVLGISVTMLALLAGLVPVGVPVATADEVPPAAAGGTPATTASPEPATPQLIDAAVESGEISEEQGALFLAYAFSDPASLPAAYRSTTPWDGTVPLMELQRTLGRLPSGSTTALARAQLRTPSFTCPNFSARTPNRLRTPHFYIQYDRTDLRFLVAGQYANALEQAFATEVTRFGWPRPPKDPVRHPAGGRYPVRIEHLSGGLYGYVTGTHFAGNNPATPWPDRDSVASCMVMNENYGPFPGTPLDAMRATAAHEFNHSIQFGYGALTGFGRVTSVFVEASATWMEDLVFEGANDNVNYLWPEFRRPMGVYKDFPYPYWVVFRAMTERFRIGVAGGSEAIFQRFWEEISRGRSTNLAALQHAFVAKGTSLGQAFHDASIALRFLRNCSATPIRRFCLTEGPLYAARAPFGRPADRVMLSTVGSDSGSLTVADNYALDWIGLPRNQPYTVTVTQGGGVGVLRVSIACLTGGGVKVTPLPGAASPVTPVISVAFDPVALGCTHVTAVVSNVKATAASPTVSTNTTYSIATS